MKIIQIRVVRINLDIHVSAMTAFTDQYSLPNYFFIGQL